MDANVNECRQLQLPGARFDPAKYPNPSLQWHYRILQALALEEEIPEFKDSDDKTVPKYRQIDKRAGEYVMNWGIALEEQVRAHGKERGGSVGIKREADEMSGASKKAKTVASSNKSGAGTLSGMSVDQVKKLVISGSLSKTTVAELKEWLSEHHLPITGKKVDLVDRIEQYLESR
jgi:ATP-dependent DNA helicase 2 subunit 1